MKKVYVKAKSKKELNHKLSKGVSIYGTEYNIFNPEGYQTKHHINNLKYETIIAIHKTDEVIPMVWGIYKPIKNKVI